MQMVAHQSSLFSFNFAPIDWLLWVVLNLSYMLLPKQFMYSMFSHLNVLFKGRTILEKKEAFMENPFLHSNINEI